MAHTLFFLGLILGIAYSTVIPTLRRGCEYNGKHYPVGDFKPSVCEPCHCDPSGQAYCAIVDCFFTACVDPVHDPKQCCPICPNGRNCKAPDGKIIKHGETYLTSSVECVCDDHNFGSTSAVCSLRGPIQAIDPPLAS